MTKAWNKALTHMKSALRLLDESEAPIEIGAHLDFTICNLEEAISAESTNAPTTSPRRANATAHSDHS